MCTPSHLPRGSLRTSNPLREGPSANRNEHVGISRPGPQPRAGETTRLGRGTVLHRFEAALTTAYFGQDGWGVLGCSGRSWGSTVPRPCSIGSNWGRVYTVSDSGIIGQAYGRKIHAREVVAIDEAGDGLCWVRLTRFGDEWLLIRSDARDVSRAVRKLRQIPAGEQSDRFPEVGP